MNKFLLILLFPSLVFAGPVTVKKDEPAPFDGVIFPTEEELELRRKYNRLTILEEENKALNLKIDIYKSDRDMWQSRSAELANDLAKVESGSFWKYAGFFALGVVASVGAAYAVRGVVK